MAKYNNDKKFDIDLKYGKVREKRLAKILEEKKIEVKTERDWWRKTGNIAIEIESYGKPSGLKSTKADYWVHILADGRKDYCILLFDVPTLKKLAEFVTVGAFTVEIILIPHELSYEVSEQQGSFVVKPPYKIYFDEDIIEQGGADAVNLVIHEFLHLGFYQYMLKDKDEETIVNSYGNFLTELLTRSELKSWIKHNI
jgi:hypothetical protein